MKKFFFCVSLVLTGLMTACIDKNEAVDADEKPARLGGSIYQELKEPNQSKLTGTFNTYLRLINDIPGLAETLNRTGSMTVFPANDSAFVRFFQDNQWGVRTYEDLTLAQKKMLINNSMLENALLVGMLSNMSNSAANRVDKGLAVKHQTNMKLTDTIQHIKPEEADALMPQNNKYWDKYRNRGIYVVSDASRPMMVHFTREYMLQNDITTLGDNSDFAILTGAPYTEGSAYIFNDRVIHGDVTCLNGYIHQMENVIVPPGNMAQVLKRGSDTKYFSRILDYFAMPRFSASAKELTNDYNASARLDGRELIDSILEVSYISNKTGHDVTTDPDGNLITGDVLEYDPGWNQYSQTLSDGRVEYSLMDIGAMFVPVDQAFEDFFLYGGEGAYLMDIYGNYKGLDNNREHLMENLDSLHSKTSILTNFVKNLMKPSFVNTVPSKFSSIKNDVQENMGMTTDLLKQKDNGKYDIEIANNGVIYKLKTMVAPDRYQSVIAPISTYDDMQVIQWAVDDPEPSTSVHALNIGFNYYLLAMNSNFGFFVPDDNAFANNYYINPTSLAKDQPEALRFFIDKSKKPILICDRYEYFPETNTVGARLGNVPISDVKSQLIDILNYHTVVLEKGETIGNGNHYYKTKHGGEIYVNFQQGDSTVCSGMQIDNGVETGKVLFTWNEKNGRSYRINHVIQAPQNSVSKTLKEAKDNRFSEFYDLCAGFSDKKTEMAWAGISDVDKGFGTTEQDNYIIFTEDRGSGKNKVAKSCLDENVKMFNTYNYTLYAPNNAAMEKAYTACGLPRWSDVDALYDANKDKDATDPDAIEAKRILKLMIQAMRDFARYHFQSVSIYADQAETEQRSYQSLCADNLGIAIEIKVKVGNNRIVVKDAGSVEHTVDANNTAYLSNKMARDYWFDTAREGAKEIYTSSFCAVHEITEPLYFTADKRYDGSWKTSAARKQSVKNNSRQKNENKL